MATHGLLKVPELKPYQRQTAPGVSGPYQQANLPDGAFGADIARGLGHLSVGLKMLGRDVEQHEDEKFNLELIRRKEQYMNSMREFNMNMAEKGRGAAGSNAALVYKLQADEHWGKQFMDGLSGNEKQMRRAQAELANLNGNAYAYGANWEIQQTEQDRRDTLVRRETELTQLFLQPYLSEEAKWAAFNTFVDDELIGMNLLAGRNVETVRQALKAKLEGALLDSRAAKINSLASIDPVAAQAELNQYRNNITGGGNVDDYSGGYIHNTTFDSIPQSNQDKQAITTHVNAASEAHGVPVNFILGVMRQESNFNPNAVSKAGAQGLMQLMPGTAKDLVVTNSFDIQQNIDGGTRYLKQMHKQFGNWEHALMAYNWGPGNVQKWLKNGGAVPQETREYVAKILGQSTGQSNAGGGISGVSTAQLKQLTELQNKIDKEAELLQTKALEEFVSANRENPLVVLQTIDQMRASGNDQGADKLEQEFVVYNNKMQRAQQARNSATISQIDLTQLMNASNYEREKYINELSTSGDLDAQGITDLRKALDGVGSDEVALLNVESRAKASPYDPNRFTSLADLDVELGKGGINAKDQQRIREEWLDTHHEDGEIKNNYKAISEAERVAAIHISDADKRKVLIHELKRAIQQEEEARGKPLLQDEMDKLVDNLLQDVITSPGVIWNSTSPAYSALWNMNSEDQRAMERQLRTQGLNPLMPEYYQQVIAGNGSAVVSRNDAVSNYNYGTNILTGSLSGVNRQQPDYGLNNITHSRESGE